MAGAVNDYVNAVEKTERTNEELEEDYGRLAEAARKLAEQQEKLDRASAAESLSTQVMGLADAFKESNEAALLFLQTDVGQISGNFRDLNEQAEFAQESLSEAASSLARDLNITDESAQGLALTIARLSTADDFEGQSQLARELARLSLIHI